VKNIRGSVPNPMLCLTGAQCPACTLEHIHGVLAKGEVLRYCKGSFDYIAVGLIHTPVEDLVSFTNLSEVGIMSHDEDLPSLPRLFDAFDKDLCHGMIIQIPLRLIEDKRRVALFDAQLKNQQRRATFAGREHRESFALPPENVARTNVLQTAEQVNDLFRLRSLRGLILELHAASLFRLLTAARKVNTPDL
jgi:hypothetical protein